MNRLKQTLSAAAALLASVAGLFAVVPPYRIDPPQFPDASTVRLTLNRVLPRAASQLLSPTHLAAGQCTPLVPGAVGQAAFDLPRPADTAVFFRADDPPPIGLMSAADVSNVLAQAITRANFFVTNGT